MRLTNNMIANKYLTNLNETLNILNDKSNKVSTGKRLNKMSDDTLTAIKAFQVRRNLSRIGLYVNSIEEAENVLTEAETAYSSLNDIVTQIQYEVLQGKNGTYNASDRTVIAGVLRSLQNQIFAVSNSKYGSRFLFGGANVKTPPFTTDVNGRLLYNGSDVDTGSFAKESIFIDIGKGMNFDISGNVDPLSGFDMSNPGDILLGTGIDADGISNNLYNIAGELARKFENNDMSDIDKLLGKLNANGDNIMFLYSENGEKINSLELVKKRFDSEQINEMQKQSELETVDIAKLIIEYKSQETSYNAALQIGSKILQLSLLDYLK